MRLASWIATASIFCLVTGASTRAQADAHEMAGPAVVQVVQIDVNGNLPAFLEQFKKFQALREKVGNKGEVRAYQATLAGNQTLSVVVTISQPNMLTLVQEGQRLQASPEWQAIIAENIALGIVPVSNSVSVDITP